MNTTSLVRTTLKTRGMLAFLWVLCVVPVAVPARAADAAPAAPPAQAPEAPPAAAGPPGQPPAAPTAQAPALPEGAMLVKKGDTVERIISRRLASLPFKQDILRKALVDKNPDAFADAKKRKLKVGAILQLPTLDDFRNLLAPAAPAMGGMPGGPMSMPMPGGPMPMAMPMPMPMAMPMPGGPMPAQAQPEPQSAQAPPEEEEDPKKGWVRYP